MWPPVPAPLRAEHFPCVCGVCLLRCAAGGVHGGEQRQSRQVLAAHEAAATARGRCCWAASCGRSTACRAAASAPRPSAASSCTRRCARGAAGREKRATTAGIERVGNAYPRIPALRTPSPPGQDGPTRADTALRHSAQVAQQEGHWCESDRAAARPQACRRQISAPLRARRRPA